jgi:hypothetical protein
MTRNIQLQNMASASVLSLEKFVVYRLFKECKLYPTEVTVRGAATD